MKKKMALLLAAALAVSAVFTTYAMNVGWGNQDTVSGNGPGEDGFAVSETDGGVSGGGVSGTEGSKPDGSETDTVSMGEGTYGLRMSQEELGDVGQVDVSIASGLVLCNSVEFQIKLTGNGREESRTARLGGGSVDGSARGDRVSFEDLADGTYVLTVSGPGFLPFSQSVQVEGKAYTIRLTTGFLKGMNYMPGAAHPGVLVVGDVNGDGAVNEADGTSLVDAIHAGTASQGLELDLNKDGAVNLADLEYFTKGFGVTEDTQATPERSVPAKMIFAETDDDTIVTDGDAEDALKKLLNGSGSVSLGRKDNAPISEAAPVEVTFEFADGPAAVTDGILIETGGDNSIADAVITVVYEDEEGNEGTAEVPVTAGVNYLLEDTRISAVPDQLGNIKVSLGGQVAMKKVTLKITGMKKESSLAEITKVEFLNGMEERIPEPQMDIPQNLNAVAGDAKISLSWTPCVNVTGYEVLIKQGDKQFTTMAGVNSITLSSFGNEKMKNYLEYQVSVQSVNGTWRSGYCGEVTAVPIPDGKPEPPDNVSAAGQYQSVLVSWKDMDDTLSYRVYYRERNAAEYLMLEVPEGTSYTITGLKDLTDYQIYVTGLNEHGESRPSVTVAATTTDLNPAAMPKYRLINVGKPGEENCHIIGASMNASMIDSPLDTQAGTAWGTVDKEAMSHYRMNSWDDGGFNPMSLKHGLTYEFDQPYEISTIAFHDLTSQDGGLFYAKVRCWDESGRQTDLTGISLTAKLDGAGRKYYVLKFPAVTAKKIQFGLARYSASGYITISEVYFYHHDTLMEEIMGLYQDDLHTVLRPEVTQADIDALRVRINTVDEVSGEYHPDKAMLERELQTAEAILNDSGLYEPVKIHGGITTKDVGRGFGGLNAWQPLGVVAAAQDKVMVYVGHKTKKTGDNTELQLVATQYYGTSAAVAKAVGTLKVGANEITVPKIWTGDAEIGGALYVQYTGDSTLEDVYQVRVSGGVQVPKLDLYQVTDAAERQARTLAYVKELESYTAQMEANHALYHGNSDNSLVNKYEYSQQTCILGASDILLDTMMFSLPAPQILAGAGIGTSEERARKILNSMDAMEDMMYLFYQHKGLNKNAEEAVNQIPKGHQNIRYQRMFAKAFMYASGNHIGIGWGSASGMMGGVPVVADEKGKYVSGQYFGWGISHEIGHCINQGAYAVAEITNNYFAVLAKAHESNKDVRFEYANVYDKVTSGTKGRASNVFTQLGMYWQLHLAYDRGYNYKTYENYGEQLSGLFFARVDTYARNPGKAPKPGGIALTLSGDKDQQLMRLACAAAEKDILEFFERWGMTPDAGTIEYAGQFARETRAICYANDESRVYWLEHGGSSLKPDGSTAAVGDITAQADDRNQNQVRISLSTTLPSEELLGYEITRYMMADGKPLEKEVIGFVTGGESEFIDTVAVNNRVMWYEVRVVDQYLNYSKSKELEPIKIQHDGSLDKTFWSISTAGLTAVVSAAPEGTDADPCEPKPEDPAVKMIDNVSSTTYTAAANGNAEIVLNFNKTLTVTGFKYTGLTGASGSGYEIYVQAENGWIKAAEGTIGQESGTVYFASQDQAYNSKGYVSTYAAGGVKFVLKNQTGGQISVTELDVLGVTGDNVDFRKVTEGVGTGTSLIGTLSADYVYDNKGNKIPKGSIVFMGAYKGSWAYNAVVLYDQDGNVVGGKDEEGNLAADSIFLAPDPTETTDITETSDGTWIYWIDPKYTVDLSRIQKVRAELYRVNNAKTNEGERLVSDSLFETVPSTLPGITLDSGTGTGQ